MHPLSRATLAGLLAFVPALAAAQALWLCGLSEDAVRLVCVADVDPGSGEAPVGSTAMVRGTSFPLDVRRQYSVDLWSPPTDMEFVEQLARSTICYRSPGCSVVMVAEPRLAMAAPARQAVARR